MNISDLPQEQVWMVDSAVLVFRFEGVGEAHRELERIVLGGRLRYGCVVEITVQCPEGEAEVLVRRKGERIGFICRVVVGSVVSGNEGKTLRVGHELAMKDVG